MMYTPGDTINKACVCQENEQIIENYVCIVSRTVVLKFWWIDCSNLLFDIFSMCCVAILW